MRFLFISKSALCLPLTITPSVNRTYWLNWTRRSMGAYF